LRLSDQSPIECERLDRFVISPAGTSDVSAAVAHVESAVALAQSKLKKVCYGSVQLRPAVPEEFMAADLAVQRSPRNIHLLRRPPHAAVMVAAIIPAFLYFAALFFQTAYAVPRLLDRDTPAHVVLMSSMAGMTPNNFSGVYSVAKRAVLGIAESLALEGLHGRGREQAAARQRSDDGWEPKVDGGARDLTCLLKGRLSLPSRQSIQTFSNISSIILTYLLY
jgi:NAD(P)-dependent dehydrogenase (short-subunit alcohol dehydrogenase family)